MVAPVPIEELAIRQVAQDLASFNGQNWKLLPQDEKDRHLAVAKKFLEKYDLIEKSK